MKLAALVLLLAVACNKSEPPLPTVTLRSAGAAPQRAVAYRTTDHSVGHFTFSSGDRADRPDLELTVDLQRDGARHRFKVTAVKFVGGADIADMFLAAEPGTLNSNEHGATTAAPSGNIVTFPAIPPLMTGFVVPFPTEPIGAGATWFVDVPIEDSSIRYEYTLVSLAGEVASVRWTASRDREHMEAEATVGFEDLLPRAATMRQSIKFESGAPHLVTTTLTR